MKIESTRITNLQQEIILYLIKSYGLEDNLKGLLPRKLESIVELTFREARRLIYDIESRGSDKGTYE